MADSEIQPSMTADQLRAGWVPRRIGRRIVVLAEVDSTNTLALAAACEPDADGLVILAEAQTAGRGRLGATWLSPRGASVLASVVLLEEEKGLGVFCRDGPEDKKEDKKGSEAFFRDGPEGAVQKRLLTPFSLSAWLTQVSAVAACDAIRQATDVTPVIKWPNDLRIAGRKVGGILIETRPVDPQTGSKNGPIPFFVVGIGINCLQQVGHFPPELRASATSLELATHQPVDRVAVARELLKALDRRLAPELWGLTEQVHRDWLAYAEPIGQKVRLRREGRDYAGWTVEVDPAGGLIVKLETGQQEWFDPMRTTLL